MADVSRRRLFGLLASTALVPGTPAAVQAFSSARFACTERMLPMADIGDGFFGSSAPDAMYVNPQIRALMQKRIAAAHKTVAEKIFGSDRSSPALKRFIYSEDWS